MKPGTHGGPSAPLAERLIAEAPELRCKHARALTGLGEAEAELERLRTVLGEAETELERLRTALRQAALDLETADARYAAQKARTKAIVASLSWRLTRPLRSVARVFSKRAGVEPSTVHRQVRTLGRPMAHLPEPALGENPWNREEPYDYSSSWVRVSRYIKVINQRITGDPDVGWIEYSARKYLNVANSTDKSCLVLGSNEGDAVVMLRTFGFQGRIVASDIAEKALARSAEKMARLGLTDIHHILADLNSHVFDEKFDYILAEGVLHHVAFIERCAESLRDALKPGGLLIAMEFVGALRFQFSDLHQQWINAALAAIPRKYRPVARDHAGDYPATAEERARVYYVTPSIEAMMAFDPSEAVSGHKIDHVFKVVFDLVEEKNGGGNIVMNITGHFPFELAAEDEECGRWLDVIAGIEGALIDSGILASDLKLYCFRNPN
jgi:SAM-dependent methyltransferase